MSKRKRLKLCCLLAFLGSVSWAVSYGDLERPKESELLWNQSMRTLADLNNQLESQSGILKTASKHSEVLELRLKELETELKGLRQSKRILEEQHQKSIAELTRLQNGIESLEKTLALYKNTLNGLREQLKRKRTNSFLIGLGIGAMVAIGGVLLIK